jgi:hypothetical protein
MWNPFLTPEERASIRRGGELMRRSAPACYWAARSFIFFCAVGCLAILVLLLLVGAYVGALATVLFWSVVYIVTSYGAARDIRRL